MKNFLKNNVLYIAWGTALGSALGSFYFSDILGFAPCILCWYQRICMLPQVLIIGTGMAKKDKNLIFYSLPLAIIGWVISIYHNLLYFKVIPESLSPCVNGVSCTTKFIEYFGFVTIPFLSFVGFTVIIASLIIHHKLNRYE